MRRLFLFLALLLFGSIFVSEAFASDFSTKAINGTEFTLLSNTSQCLSNCEAWIKWDLSKGITSNVLLPNKANSQFGFELKKANSKTKGLDNFGVEVWGSESIEVTDYCRTEEPFDFAKAELDTNGLGQTCEDIGCASKDKDNCSCVRIQQPACGSHFETVWSKISDSIYNFEAEKGKVYRLRVWGKRTPGIEENSVDWIPTFFGQEISEWAWWNNSWASRFPINSMVVFEDLNATNWLKITKVDFSALNSQCADAADIRVADATTEVSDLNFQGWDGTNTDSDVNLLFKLRSALPAGTYEGEYYIYSNNAGCPAATNKVIDQMSFDDFEDGDMTIAPWWYRLEGGGTEATTTVEASAKKFGSYGLKVITSTGNYTYYSTDVNTRTSPEFTFCGWMYVTDSTGRSWFRGKNGADNHFIFGMYQNKFLADSDETSYNGWVATPTNSTWYKLCVHNSTTAVTFTIYNAAEAFVEEWVTAAVETEALTIIDILTDGDKTAFYDNVGFENPTNPSYALGGEETNEVSDLNITTINGVSFKTHPVFAFGIDGNITLDFNVFYGNNARLTIDLNYSPITSQGGGTIIVKDLNLTSNICPDQDWSDSPSTCSYSWDYSDAPDGNYTIIGLLSTGDFNTGDGNFEIANDVTLVIQVPIDEESFEVLDFNTYTFRVSYSDGNNVFIYDFNSPLNLSIPLGTLLTFEIDENTSEYYKRGYYLNFPAATSSASLQPYLVKKATAGGGGIQSVLFTRTENNKAVPDIEIRAYRIVPDSGKTLMEQLITDAAGSATFAFVQGANYTLDFARDGNVFSSDLILRPVYTSYQFYLSAEIFNVPDENGIIFDVNYSPEVDYIDSNSWADINISINVENATISDLNILIYLDDNTLYNANVAVDGFYALPPVSIVGAVGILNVEVILTTSEGIKISRSKAYSFNLSEQQSGLTEFFEALPGLVNFNRHSEHLEISTLGCLILTLFICGAIKSKSQIDTGGTALFAMLILGIFTYMGLVYWPAFAVAGIICFGLILFTRSF